MPQRAYFPQVNDFNNNNNNNNVHAYLGVMPVIITHLRTYLGGITEIIACVHM